MHVAGAEALKLIRDLLERIGTGDKDSATLMRMFSQLVGNILSAAIYLIKENNLYRPEGMETFR